VGLGGGVVCGPPPWGAPKTGWFCDQRDNRAFMAGLAEGARVLDLHCYGGGFAVACAKAGAAQVLGIDRAQAALDLAAAAAARNGVDGRCSFRREQVFDALERLVAAGERFDVVIADPPAFVKSRKDLAPGLKGYRRLARLAAQTTAPEGFLFIASCSHNVTAEAFAQEVARGVGDAGRIARIVRTAGAAPDHPVHPLLPETAYLKALVLALD
jgi:23S rRNA (cytosine1962-C5)-methyltransferase